MLTKQRVTSKPPPEQLGPRTGVMGNSPRRLHLKGKIPNFKVTHHRLVMRTKTTTKVTTRPRRRRSTSWTKGLRHRSVVVLSNLRPRRNCKRQLKTGTTRLE